MKTTKDWITEIDFEISRLKLNKRTSYFGFSLQMDNPASNEVKKYFEDNGYNVEMRECPRKLYDCVITW